LDDDFHVQIADFGLTRLLDATNTRSGAKHFNFAAPELFGCFEDPDDPSADEPKRTPMSDVYAFGCIYYEVRHRNISMPFADLPRSITIVYHSPVNKTCKSWPLLLEVTVHLDWMCHL